MKKPTPAQLAARARFAEMARSGAFKKKAATKRKKTVSQKISQLVREGYPQKQAVAVALSEQRAGKVKANPRASNPAKRKANPMPNQVTETIYQQLGGNRFAMMTGAKNFVAYPDLLEFSIPRNASSANRVRVFYEPGTDLYTLTFNRTSVTAGGVKSTEIARFDDVYADQLQPLFTQVTGMYTSLGTMGRKTNPATGQKGSRTKRNPQPRMAKIAWLTPGGQREVMEVPIDFAFKEYIGNIQEDFFARTDNGFLVVTEKSTGMKVGQVPHTMRAAALNDKAAAKRFVQSIAEKVGAPAFRAAIAKHPRIA